MLCHFFDVFLWEKMLQKKCYFVFGATRFSTSFLRGMLHGEWKAWLCLFFYKKNTIVGVQRVYKRKHEIVWYMMMMHGYAYLWSSRLFKRIHEIVWNMMQLWNSLKYAFRRISWEKCVWRLEDCLHNNYIAIKFSSYFPFLGPFSADSDRFLQDDYIEMRHFFSLG